MSARTTAEDRAIDRIVGANIRLRRKLLGLTQGDLAAHLGLTFQQVQKYERGANRVAAPILLRIAGALNATVDALYEGAEPPAIATVATGGKDPVSTATRFLAIDGGLAIVQAFTDMSAPRRRALVAAARALAKQNHEDA